MADFIDMIENFIYNNLCIILIAIFVLVVILVVLRKIKLVEVGPVKIESCDYNVDMKRKEKTRLNYSNTREMEYTFDKSGNRIPIKTVSDVSLEKRKNGSIRRYRDIEEIGFIDGIPTYGKRGKYVCGTEERDYFLDEDIQELLKLGENKKYLE